MNLIQLFLYFIIYLFIICLPQLNNLSYAIDYNSSTTQIKGSNSSFGTLPFNEVKVMFHDIINTLQDINSELNNHSSAIDYLRIVIPSTHNNSTSNKLIDSQTNNTNLTITIRTDKSKYYNDEDITIFGKVYDDNLKLTNTVLSVTPIFNETSFFSSSHESKQPLILQKTEIPVIDGIYNFTLYLSKQGLYNISISDKNGNNERFLIVEAKNKFFSYTFMLIYLIIILIILYGLFTWLAIRGKLNNKSKQGQNNSSKNSICRFLIWLKRKPKLGQTPPPDQHPANTGQTLPSKNSSSEENKDEESIDTSKFKYEVLRFFILSAISIIPLISFMVMDVEIGKFSPIGLVLQNQNSNDTQQNTENVQWIINIGGSVSDNYSKGITIPFYVFAFGWLGGYLRYLYRVFTKISSLHDNKTELNKMVVNANLWLYKRYNKKYVAKYPYNILPLFLYSSFEELAEILLSPLLAIAVWLLLNIFDSTLDIFTASLISFAVGLITKDVIKRIIEFSKSTIGGSTNEVISRRSNDDATPEYIK